MVGVGEGGGGTAHHFPLCLYLCSLDKERALAQVSVRVCAPVCVRRKGNRLERVFKFNLVDLRGAFQRR